MAAFLQLGGQLDLEVWNEKILEEQIHAWFAYRDKQAGRQSTCPEIDITVYPEPLAGNQWLVISELWMNPREGSKSI